MSDVKRFLRKPTEIQAIQWTGDNLEQVEEFTNLGVDLPNIQSDGNTLHLMSSPTSHGCHWKSASGSRKTSSATTRLKTRR